MYQFQVVGSLIFHFLSLLTYFYHATAVNPTLLFSPKLRSSKLLQLVVFINPPTIDKYLQRVEIPTIYPLYLPTTPEYV